MRKIGGPAGTDLVNSGDAAPVTQTTKGRAPAAPFAWLCAAWLVASFTLPGFLSLGALLSLGSSGLIWPALAVWIAVPIAAFGMSIKRLWAGRYYRAAAWSLVPAAVVVLCLYGSVIGDVEAFWLNKASYDRVVADAAAGRCSSEDRQHWTVATDAFDCSEPIIIVFIWDGLLSSWSGIVYDAADQIIKSPNERSAAWKNREAGRLLSCSRAWLALGGHYYRAGGNFGGGPCD